MLPRRLAPTTAARRSWSAVTGHFKLAAAQSAQPLHHAPLCTRQAARAQVICLSARQRATPSTGHAGQPGPCQRGPAGRRKLTRPVCCSLHKGTTVRWHCRAQVGKTPHMQSFRSPSAARATGTMKPLLPWHCCHKRRLDSEAPQQLLHLPQEGAIVPKVHQVCGAHCGEGQHQHSASGSHPLCAAASHRSRSHEMQSESCAASMLHRAQDWQAEQSA